MRAVHLALALALTLSLAACGTGDSSNNLQTGLGGGGTPSTPPGPVTTPVTQLQDGAGTGMTTRELAFASEVFRLINEYRTNNGGTALTWNASVAKVAQDHTINMQDTGVLTHDGPAPCAAPADCLGMRLATGAVTFTTAGENIARGQATPADVMAAWQASAGHNANMLDASYTQIGIGYREAVSPANAAAFGPWWTQVFRTP